MKVKAGGATRIINCEPGDELGGQLYRRICERIRDDLEANFLYLSNEHESILLISLDLLGFFENSYIRDIGTAIEAKIGVPARNVIITSTHTHTGPDIPPGLIANTAENRSYLEKLHDRLLDGAQEAVTRACPAHVGCAMGHAHIGYNRRLCWEDGSHSMYGDSSRPDFVGLEGPDDPSHAVFFATDSNAKHIAVLHNNCCHATCIESDTVVSADFPGEARALLRRALGADLPVLYLQGASGDISPWNMLKTPYRYDGEQRVREIGSLLAGETLRLLHKAQVTDNPVLRHVYEDIEMGVRLPTDEELKRAREVQARGEDKARRGEYVLNVFGVLRLYESFKDNPVDTLAIHAVRIGDFAITTNPCEFYCQFGLDIKRRSSAPVTAIVQLADGFSGYCPTLQGIQGGGYSGDVLYWCRLEPYAGYKIVEVSAKLLHSLWKGA